MTVARLFGAMLAAALLLVAGTWYGLLHTEAGARWIWSRAVSATGDAMSADDIRGNLGSGVSLTQFSFVADGVQVRAAKARVDASLGLLPLRVVVGTAQISGLRIVVPGDGTANGDREHRPFRPDVLQLPFELSIGQLELDDAKLLRGAAQTLATIDRATFAAHWAEAIRIERLDLRMPGLGAVGDGRLQLQEPYDIGADLQVTAQPGVTGLRGPVDFRVAAVGPLGDFAVEAQMVEPRATLSGRISGITQSLRWDLDLEVIAATLPPVADTPDIPPLSVIAEGNGGLEKFTVTATVSVADTNSSATLSADVDVESQTLDGNLDWTSAQWPLAGAEPRVASRRGRLAVSGALDDWAVDGTVQLFVPGLPAGQFKVDGGGNRNHAAVRIIEGNVLGGSVAGRAEYHWRDRPAYSANLDLHNVETRGLFPDWPATLSGHVVVRGRQRPLELSVMLGNVVGEFRNKPVRASGGIGFRDGALTANDLSIEHGDTSLRVHGNPYAGGGLHYSVSVSDLADYVDEAYGTLIASGTFSLRPDGPHLEIQASSPELGYRDGTVFDLEIADSRRDGDIFDIELTASSVQYGQFVASDVRIAANAGPQQQAVELAFTTDGLGTVLVMEGELDDWHAPTRWTGQLEQLELRHAEFTAALAGPSAVRLTRRSASIRDLCLANEQGASVCATGSWGRNAGARFSGDLSSVPAGMINAVVDSGFRFNQVLSGDLDWRMAPNGRSSGRADITMSSGAIVSRARPDLVLETGDASLRFRIDNNSLRSGLLDIPLPDLGQAAARFEVLDVAGDGSATIQGTIDVDLDDIRFVEAVFPALDDVAGRAAADLVVSGSISAPEITGNVSLHDGSVSYVPVGLRLTQLSLEGELGGAGEIEMTGSFKAGDGRGRIRTRTNASQAAGRGLILELQGKNLTLVDVPDVRAIADTDVTVGFDGRTLQLDGRVDVPYARIRPQNIGIDRISESDDVVIVKGELPERPANGKPDTKLLFQGSVEMSLGQDVVVELSVADAHLTGSTVFTWSGPPMPVANGRYVLKGEILAYGQKLDISEGAIRFPNVPANDPYLRIRAEREIFGNTQVRRAGVLVSGTASRPTIEAYTTPMTTEERALTLLVTGSEFDYEKGIGAFDFGTYIAPRVYASYGIGLFDQNNVIRVRYDLTEGFGLTLTSGARDEGVDLTYRFDN